MTTTADPLPPAVRRGVGVWVPPWLGALVVTAALVALTGWLSPPFLRPANLMGIAREQAAVGILAVGLTLVITAGGIDLSVGSLLALSGGVGVLMLDRAANVWAWPGWLATVAAAVVTLAIATAAGWVNGLLVARGRLPAFIATLAALLAYRSAAQWIAHGGQFHPSVNVAAFSAVGGGLPLPHTDIRISHRPGLKVLPLVLPWVVVVWAIVAAWGVLVLNRTRLGRYGVAVGSNARAARYSGVPVAAVRTRVYVLGGLLAGVAGFLEAARMNAVNSGDAGLYFELYAIAAAVMGGTRMEGGTGSIFGSVVGTLLLGVIFNVIVLLPALHVLGREVTINTQARGVVIGAVIIVAALIQRGGAKE